MFRIILSPTLFLFALVAMSQAPKSVLTNADIDRYLTTFKSMVEDFDALGDKVDNLAGDDATSFAGLWAVGEARSILVKYGWDEFYGPKFMAITMGTAYLMMEKQIAGLPAEQANTMKGMLGMYQGQIHADDLKLLRPKLDKLQALMESMD